MKLVSNWKAIAKKSHSMWAFYLSLVFLLLPEALYYFLALDTNPHLWFWLGVAFLVYGICGRLKDQGIDRTTLRSPLYVVLLAAIIAGGGVFLTGERPHEPADVPRLSQAGPEQLFLQEAIPLVSKWEGLRTEAYLDTIASPPVWTVCYGETVGVKAGDSYTADECAAMLGRRILVYRTGLHRYMTPETLAQRLPPTRDAAYTSLAYNVGVAGAGKSTATKRLNAGDIRGGCEALTWWNKAGGRVIRGLVNRRAEEQAKCLVGA
ncbi:MAG: lysozyme [Rhodobacteraceae bacterium]|nr:lysozyme [Paracoccaceae bacterium]